MSAHLDLDHLDRPDGRPVPPVEQVHARAAVLRRRRRRTTTVLCVGVLAAALGAGGLALPQGGGAPGSSTPVAATFLGVQRAAAADGEAACDRGVAEALDRGDWGTDPVAAGLTAVLASPDLAPLRGVSMDVTTWNCPAATPVVALYADDPVRGVLLFRDVANPYDGQSGLTERRVRGVTARVMTFDTGALVLSWVDPDGVRWLAQAGGMSEDAAVGVLDGLVLDPSGAADPASVPGDLVAAAVPPQQTGTRRGLYLVQYGSPGPEWTDDRVILSVGSTPSSEVDWAASGAPGLELVHVRGTLAEYEPGSAGDPFGQLRWTADGRTYVLVGTGGASRLVTLAESLEHVDPGDPRVAGALDLADVPDAGH